MKENARQRLEGKSIAQMVFLNGLFALESISVALQAFQCVAMKSCARIYTGILAESLLNTCWNKPKPQSRTNR